MLVRFYRKVSGAKTPSLSSAKNKLDAFSEEKPMSFGILVKCYMQPVITKERERERARKFICK